MSLEFDADKIELMIFIHTGVKDKDIIVECNYCDLNTMVFYSGSQYGLSGSKWLSAAGQHIARKHQSTYDSLTP